MKKTILFLLFLVLFVVPAASFAQNELQQMPRIPAGQIPTNPVTPPDMTLRNNYPSSSSFGCNQLKSGETTIADLFDFATCLISTSIIPLIFALATAMFIWGVVQYVINAQEEAKRQKGRQFMIWGIIALAVMVSVWGLVGILRNTFGIQANVIPSVQTNR